MNGPVSNMGSNLENFITNESKPKRDCRQWLKVKVIFLSNVFSALPCDCYLKIDIFLDAIASQSSAGLHVKRHAQSSFVTLYLNPIIYSSRNKSKLLNTFVPF